MLRFQGYPGRDKIYFIYIVSAAFLREMRGASPQAVPPHRRRRFHPTLGMQSGFFNRCRLRLKHFARFLQCVGC